MRPLWLEKYECRRILEMNRVIFVYLQCFLSGIQHNVLYSSSRPIGDFGFSRQVDEDHGFHADSNFDPIWEFAGFSFFHASNAVSDAVRRSLTRFAYTVFGRYNVSKVLGVSAVSFEGGGIPF